MRRNQQQQGDTVLQIDLDAAFVGVNNRMDPALLGSGEGAGLVADAWNCRFNAGKIETRKGCTTPVHFNPLFESLHGAGIFANPNGGEWLIAVDRFSVWQLADGITPRQIRIPNGTRFDSTVEVVQCFSNVVIFRGVDAEVLQWDGQPTTAFRPVTEPDPRYNADETPTYLQPTPNADFGIVAADRLWVPIVDTLVWSEIGRYDAFDLALNQARLNQGDDDEIVAMLYYEATILVWKSQSLYRLSGVVGDLSGLGAERLNGSIGCIARASVVQVGADVLWLAQGGVYRLQQVFESRMATAPLPVSDAIADTIDRINWLAAHVATGTLVGNYYWLAVPIDGSLENNAILIYDTTTGQWQGVDTFGAPPEEMAPEPAPAGFPIVVHNFNQGLAALVAPTKPPAPIVRMQKLLRADLNGVRTPFLIDAARILALNTGKGDEISGDHYEIEMRVELRGFRLGSIGLNSLRSFTLDFSTWNAEFSISALADGVNETQKLATDVSESRLKYTRWGKAAWVPSNANNDFNAPHRRDYAWMPGDGSAPQAGGIRVFLPQSFTVSYPARMQGQWLSLRITNKQGWFALHRAAVDGLGPRSTLHRRD